MISAAELLNFSGKRKLPLVLQTEMAECGLACLAMIAGYYGYNNDMVTLRSKYPVPLTGATLKSVMAIADQMNLVPRPVKVKLDQLMGVRTPAILHWNMNHFVVLKQVKSDRVVIHDPAQGIRELDPETVSKHFTGIVLELVPTKDFEQKDERSHMHLSDFWDRIRGLGGSLTQILVLSLVLQLFVLAGPLYMQLVVDEAVLSRDESLLTVLALGFLMLVVLEIATSAFRSYVVLVIGNMLSVQMASNLFRHLIRLPLKYFENRHIGDTVSRFGSLESVRELLTTGFVAAVVDGLMSTIMLMVLFVYSPMLALTVVGVLCLYLAIRLIFFRPFRQLTEEAITTRASEQSNFMETVRGVQAIKLFCNELERQTLWQNRFADQVNAGIRLGRYTIGFEFANGLLFGLENILVIYLGAHLILDNAFTIGMLYAFVAYKQRFLQNAQNLIEKAIEFKMAKLHLERLADIVKTPAESTSDEHLSQQRKLSGKLELVEVGYRYSQGDTFLFHDVNLTVEAGEVLAVVGASGCGKTTLMKVMLGLFEPSKGNLLVDGVRVERLGLRAYRSQVAAVMQDDKLFSGSVADNIAFFDAQPDRNRIEQCARQACIHEEIFMMPMGYHTLVGDMGTTLSGGQKQRLLLARALYRRPKILFLDEATSHLDSANEQKVNDNLRNLKITRVVIAHRESTIQMADRVVAMFDGRLLEADPEEVLEQNFAALQV